MFLQPHRSVVFINAKDRSGFGHLDSICQYKPGLFCIPGHLNVVATVSFLRLRPAQLGAPSRCSKCYRRDNDLLRGDAAALAVRRRRVGLFYSALVA